MNKFVLSLTAILFLALYITVSGYIERGREITRIETEKNALNGNINFLRSRIDEDNKKALETSKRIEELESIANKDKSFDWNIDLSNSPVVMRLHQD